MKAFLLLPLFFVCFLSQAQVTIYYQIPSYRFPTTHFIDSGFTLNSITQIEYIGSSGDEGKNIFNGTTASYQKNSKSLGVHFTNFYSTNINDEIENFPYRNISYQILSLNKSIHLKEFTFTGAISFTRKKLRTKSLQKQGVDFGFSVAWRSHYLAVSKLNAITTSIEGMYPFFDNHKGLYFQYIFTKKWNDLTIQPSIVFNSELRRFSTLSGLNLKYKSLLIGICKLDNYKSMHKIGWDFGQFKVLIGREGILFSSLAVLNPQYFQFQVIYSGKSSTKAISF